MKQITEDFVSFEIAKLLKEKGFDEICNFEYGMPDVDNGYVLQKWIITNGQIRNSDLIDGAYTASTHQIALKWLREVHGFIVTIDYDRYPVDNGENDVVGYGYNIQIKDNPEDYYRISESVYDCYEEATEAALLYVLKNLI